MGAPANTEAAPAPDLEAAAEIIGAMGLGNEPTEEGEADTDPAPAPEAEKAEAAAEPAKDEGKDKPPPVAVPDEEWTKTPEGVAAKAAEMKTQLEELNRERLDFQKRYGRVAAREEKLKTQVERFKRAKSENDTMRDWVSTNLRALRTGDASTRLQALGALTGMPGHEFYESLSIGLASDGKMGQPSVAPEVAALQQQIAQLQRHITQRQQYEQQAAEQQELQQFREAAVDLGKNGGNQVCATVASVDPELFADEAQRIAVLFRQQNGQPIDRVTLLGHLEQRLTNVARALSAAQPNAAAPSEGETDLETVAQAKPGTARRSPRAQTLSQSASSAGATRRPATEAERKRLAEDLIPDAWLSNH